MTVSLPKFYPNETQFKFYSTFSNSTKAKIASILKKQEQEIYKKRYVQGKDVTYFNYIFAQFRGFRNSVRGVHDYSYPVVALYASLRLIYNRCKGDEWFDPVFCYYCNFYRVVSASDLNMYDYQYSTVREPYGCNWAFLTYYYKTIHNVSARLPYLTADGSDIKVFVSRTNTPVFVYRLIPNFRLNWADVKILN